MWRFLWNRLRRGARREDPAVHRESVEEPELVFVLGLPDPGHNRPVQVFEYRGFSVEYYRNPESFGKVMANVSPPFTCAHVAVVEHDDEPMLMIRTEESAGGATYICTLDRNGFHVNLGELPCADTNVFLQRVGEELSSLIP